MKSTSTKPRPYTQTNRAQSAEATADRIIDAFLARLMAHWYDEITLDRIAADAATTVQTILRRFESKDGLLAAALQVLGKQITAIRVAHPHDLDRTLANLFEDYEQTGDPILRLLALETRHPSLKTFIDYGRAHHRDWVTQAFLATPPLDTLAGAARERAIDLLVITTDVYTWKLLRRDMPRSRPLATSLMKSLVQGTIAQISGTKHP